MSGVCKVGDMGVGICPCHKSPVSYTTVFVSGAGSVNTNGSPTCNLTTVGGASCGHPTVVLTVSGTVNAEGTGVHRLGDLGANCGNYTATTSSGNVNAGG